VEAVVAVVLPMENPADAKVMAAVAQADVID